MSDDTYYIATPFLAITTLLIEAEGGDAVDDKLMVSSSDSWVAEVSEEARDWISVSPMSGDRGVTYIYISIDSELVSRVGEIVVTSESFTKSIEIVQLGDSQADQDAEEEDAEEENTEEEEEDDELGEEEDDDDDDDVEEEEEEEDDDDETESDEEKDPEIPEVETILTLSTYLTSVSALSGSFNIDVTSNTKWSVSESLDWVVLSSDGGENDGVVTVSYDENLSITARSGAVTFSADGVEDVEYIITQQSAAENISIDKLSGIVDCSSGSLIMDVTSNSSWTVVCESSWIHPVRESGSGNEVLTVSYDENTTPYQRIAFITIVTPSGESVLFTLTQGAADPIFIVKPTTHIALPKDGGEYEISISTNVDWAISASESWVQFDQSSGSGSATVTISAGVNDSQTQRTATITISAWSGYFTRTITIGQEMSQLPDFNIDEL